MKISIFSNSLQVSMLAPAHLRGMVVVVVASSNSPLRGIARDGPCLATERLRLQAGPMNGALKDFHPREAIAIDLQLNGSSPSRVETYHDRLVLVKICNCQTKWNL